MALNSPASGWKFSRRRPLESDVLPCSSIPTILYIPSFGKTSSRSLLYSGNVPDLSRRAAAFVVKILNGAKASELPIEQPTKFELVINLKTAKALGLDVPPTLLARTDEVIE